MKTKEKRFLGIFKKKTTPAPVAPPLQDSVDSNSIAAVSTTTEEKALANTPSSLPKDVMPPRKGSIAQTSVLHYSPPGTVRASFQPSATSSVVSGGSDDTGTVVITRKSNIVLDDEESVISTPVSQYDESPIVQKPRTKRAAPPPPPTQPTPIASIPPMSPSLSSKHFRQISTNSTSSTTLIPPPPPPHRKQDTEVDYEEMLKKLQNKFDEWNMVRLEDGGSIKEERIKSEMLKDHEKLRILLEKQITSDRPKPSSTNNNNSKTSNNNNNNVKKVQSPMKIPQYGNFYAQPPSSPSPPARVGAVPGGTVYQKIEKAPSKPSSSSSVLNGKPMSPKTDENRNEVKKKVSATGVQNTEAVDRLRREVEEQRQREKEVKDYRNPKTLAVDVKSPEPKRKEILPPPPSSPTKSGPRMVEYKPMKSPGLPVEPEEIYEVIDEKAPPIPNTPPPKLSEYRKEQQSTAPRMPTVPSNGYVRLQMNGAAKKLAPTAPVVSPILQQIAQKPYTGPEFASSPKLLRKNIEPSAVSPKVYSSVPVREEKKYEKPQVHPQMTNGNSGGMITATSPSSSPYRKSQGNPPLTRGASVDQNGYGYSTKVPVSNGAPTPKPPVTSSPVNYRKMVKAVAAAPITRPVSEDKTNYGYASKTTINIATSPYTQRRTPSPSKMSQMARAMSTDQASTPVGSPSPFRKSSAPPAAAFRSLSTENPAPSPSTNRRSMPTAGILSATSSKSAVTSATSPPYPKGSTGPTIITIKSGIPNAPKLPKPTTPQGETFDISDVLKGPKLRKIGMPVERSGISLGKVVETEPSTTRPSSTPPPPPPPPPPGVLASPSLQPLASKNPDVRDSLMSEIREAGRLRAARVAQSA